MGDGVVVTGIGVVSPIGTTVADFWRSLLHAESRPEVQAQVPVRYMRYRHGYCIRDFPRAISPEGDRAGLATSYAVRATEAALADAGLLDNVDDSLIGVALGTAMGDSDLLEEEREGGAAVGSLPRCFFRVAAATADRFGLCGPNLSIGTACSAGAYSVSLARETILNGDADVMVTGGAEGFTIVPQACFNRLGALDPLACRPFDAERAGTVFGDGAAILILESIEHARRRRHRHAYAEITGCGWSCDGYHPTAPEPSGRQLELAITRALTESGLRSDDIGCVIPHGTGTELNDLIESATLERVFDGHLERLLVTAVKSKVGHSAGAAGAFSCLTAALILDRELVPPTGNLKSPEPRCALRLHRDGPVPASVRNVLVNSSAFGGNNVALVLGKPDRLDV